MFAFETMIYDGYLICETQSLGVLLCLKKNKKQCQFKSNNKITKSKFNNKFKVQNFKNDNRLSQKTKEVFRKKYTHYKSHNCTGRS